MLLREDVNKRNAIKSGNGIQLIDISDKEDAEAEEDTLEDEEESSQES
jgi:hypothetical protein